MTRRDLALYSLVVLTTLTLSARADECRFERARPVWPAGLESEMNTLVRFSASWSDISVPTSAVLRVTGSNVYRIRVNGKYVGYGPARGPKGWFRVDAWRVEDKLVPGTNEIAVDVASYNCNSYYLMNQPPFLEAEVVVDGKVRVATGRDFKAERLPRIARTPRYSFQRTFSEAYRIDPLERRKRLKLAEQATVRHLERLAPYPSFPVHRAVRPILLAWAAIDASKIVPPIRFVDTDGKNPAFRAYAKKNLEINLWDDAVRLTMTDPRPIAVVTGKPTGVGKGTCVTFDNGRIVSGFPMLKVHVSAPGKLVFTFDETLRENGVDPTRMTCCNVIEWIFERSGTYELESFEPYAFRYSCVSAFGCDVSIDNVSVREIKNGEVGQASFRCSDPSLEKIFTAAKETFAQNAVDVFTDCPGRERAGWLCDSFFIARVNRILCGNDAMEKLFLQNYALPKRFEGLPEGMVPMCYPADHADGNFIPNWGMWLVLETEEYLARSGDRELVEILRPRLLSFVRYLNGFRNSDGLLENLPKWVFVEYSKANDFVQDVSYPSNMMWAEVLSAMNRMYDLPELAEEAEGVRRTIRRQSFNGRWFCDNAVRQKDGTLRLSGECTETCQYYAFYFRTATAASHPALWRTLVEEFGPGRSATGKHREIAPSNAFIGNYLRLECLSREGLRRQILAEIRDFFLHMAERTGTLWENTSPTASCDHGFASHAAVLLLRDVVGLKAIDSKRRRIDLSVKDDLDLTWFEGCLPASEDTSIRFGWRKGEEPYAVWEQRRTRMTGGATER